LKRHVCKQCCGYLAPGVNARVRIDGRNVLITCQRCGGIKRYPYKITRGAKDTERSENSKETGY
jgi:RNase P subunit RPR2